MIRRPNRRDIVKTTGALAVAGAWGARRATPARAEEPRNFSQIDAALRTATSTGAVPGVVAMAANEDGVIYEGIVGKRRVNEGPAMTRDTVFRVASMVKLITSVAALQLVEQGKLALDAPAPNTEPEIAAPQVLDGFDAKGLPQLRPAKRPITLRHLLTHTSGFAYGLWDDKALRYAQARDRLPPRQRKQAPHVALMFDPGEGWQYGTSINWVGRMVALTTGVPLDKYFNDNIFAPLGMKDTAFIVSKGQRDREASMHRRKADGSLMAEPLEPLQRPSPGQSFSGGGGIHSTAPDYLTLLRALLRGGALDGARILRPETVALMGQNQIGEVDVHPLKTTAPWASNDVDLFPGVPCKWGFGHMINMQPVAGGRAAGSLTWGGILNTYYWIDPATKLAAVFMTQVAPFADSRALPLYRQFERGLYAAVKAG
jgi:CubicO group peptidase (beta-lactamase class C family)